MGCDGASSWPPSLSSHDRRGASKLAESEHAQHILGSTEGLYRRSAVPPHIDPLATHAALQGRITNIAVLLERQSTTNHPPIAPMQAYDQLAPHTPPPPQPREGTVKGV